MVFQNNLLMGAAAATSGSTAFTIDYSCRFNDGDSAYLNRTFGTPTNQKKWTYSCWIKRGDIGNRSVWGLAASGAYFQADQNENKLNPYVELSGSGSTASIITAGEYRDISAWYHLVVIYDSDNDITTERFKFYINGKLEADNGTATYPNDGTTPALNKASTVHNIGRFVTGIMYWDGLMSQCVFCDGQAYSPENFGEYDSYGVWRPKNPGSLTFGDNGFYLDFADSSDLGNDISGNNNDWTSNNLTSDDQVTDTPTNNFAVWNNRVYNASAVNFSEANTKIVAVNSGYPGVWTIIPSTILIPDTGKWCWKVTNVIANAYQAPGFMGNSLEGHWGDGNSTSVTAQDFVQYYIAAGELTKYIDNSATTQSVTVGSTGTTGIECYIDNDNNTAKFYLGGTQLGSDVTGLSVMKYAFIQVYDANNRGVETDFGQYGFTRTDDSYEYLSTANLPEATVKEGRKYFYPITYEGNGKGQTVGDWEPVTESYSVANSAAFKKEDTCELDKTFGTAASSTKDGTLSVWFKQSSNFGSAGHHLMMSENSSGDLLKIDTTGDIIVQMASTNGKWTSGEEKLDIDRWHNLVVAYDLDNGTATDRIQVYLDGVNITDNGTFNTAFSDTAMKIFQNSTACTIGGRAGSSTAGDYLFDGYMAEYCWCDGQVLNADNFGQIDTTTNNWVPKDVSGLTFGNNGFYLNFADKNDLGDDESGNTNDWTESGFDTTNGSNQYHDTPTRNFATFDPYQIGTTSTSVEDCMLHFTSSASGTHEQAIRSTFQNPKTGKWYAEFEVFNVSGYPAIIPFVSTEYNVQQANFDVSAADYGIRINASGGFMVVLKNIAETNMTATGWSYSTGDVVQVAIDCDNDRFYMGVNDSWNAELGGDPDDSGAGTYFPFSTIDGTLFNASSYASRDVTVNFGQWQYFDATDLSETSGAKGFFRFTPPTGFKACNNDNMKDVDSYQTGFQWTKNRDSTDNHMIFDRVRGPYKDIHFNTGSAEVTNYNTLQRFLKQGHEIGEDVEVNSDQEGFIGWNWFIETTGSGTSNTTGSLNTTRTLVDANAGISVGLYDGNSTAGATVGHGLGKAPKMVIINEVSGAETPFVGHEGATIAGGAASWHYGIYMSSTAAPYDLSIYFNDTAPTSTVFSLGSHAISNESGSNYAYYAFAEIEGYSRFAHYVGNGTADGEYIFLGFRPAFIMIRCVSTSGNWVLYDTRRSRLNPVDDQLLVNSTAAETTGSEEIDIYSNGFKCLTSDADINSSDARYAYAAFAEHPFGGESTTPILAR